MTFIIFALILSFLVLIHELGHFLAAKWAKIRVEEFGLGYPPKALVLFKKWGTVFTLNWLPFGGFVRMEGEDGEDSGALELSVKPPQRNKKGIVLDERGEAAFFERSALERMVVILAGATTNLVFGVLAFAIVFCILGIPSGAIIDQVAPGSPAAAAGITPAVAVIGFRHQGQVTNTGSTLEIIQFVENHRGQNVTVITTGPCQNYVCENEIKEFNSYLRTKDETPAEQGSLGLAFKGEFFKFYPWYEMPLRGSWYGFNEALKLGQQILLALKTLGTRLVQVQLPEEIAGPVGIVDQAAESGLFQQGPLALLFFAGMLSINLGIMNLLPIPALDGGRAVFIILEKVIGREKMGNFEYYANYGGFVFLVALIMVITARDIWRIFT
ncbi:MAG TPA: site-2 protease family protein [Vitreimonas sp.]|nr:site-2 protease family protein [Vitreimonas sp.]